MSWHTFRQVLKEGDILNVDVTALKDGWHGDTSRMFKVGEVSIKAEKLINTTYEAMMKAINIVKDGVHLEVWINNSNSCRSRVFSSSRFLWSWNRTDISQGTNVLHYGKKELEKN